MMSQTQVVFLIGYSVIFIYAIAIFGLIWQMSKKKTKKKKCDKTKDALNDKAKQTIKDIITK